MSQLMIGFGRWKITPPVGVRLYGYPNARQSHSVHDDLYANVLAFSQETERGLLVSLDLCCLDHKDVDQMRRAISEIIPVPMSNLIVAAIHTHSGPITHTSAGWGSTDQSYMIEILTSMVLAAAKEAWENLQPAEMGIGETTSQVGINRRELTPEGEVILGQNPQGPLDERMRVLAFRKPSGEPIVSVIHYGCHPTSCGPGPEITRDWPGYMTDALAAYSGAPAVFVNGAEGDVGPRLPNGRTIGDIRQTEYMGKIAGEDAIRAFQAVTDYHTPAFAVRTGVLSLPYSPLPSLEDTKKALEALGDPEKLIEVNIRFLARYRNIISHYEKGLPHETHWQLPVTLFKIGDVAVVPFPFEMFCEISMNLQASSPFAHTLSLSNANGCIGYMPTKEQIPYGGYEVDSFHSGELYVLQDDAGDHLSTQFAKLLKELF